MTLAEFLSLHGSEGYKASSLSQRPGQFAYNLLSDHNRELANALNGTSADPFYDDANLPAFWSYLERYWVDSPT